ncbi:MAG: hypothetical protein DCC75_01740 [Proteobacteria bacterium]|nr:MAG: hypothetical protein DCC75_01740 [Pseudomonadota bacterium]
MTRINLPLPGFAYLLMLFLFGCGPDLTPMELTKRFHEQTLAREQLYCTVEYTSTVTPTNGVPRTWSCRFRTRMESDGRCFVEGYDADGRLVFRSERDGSWVYQRSFVSDAGNKPVLSLTRQSECLSVEVEIPSKMRCASPSWVATWIDPHSRRLTWLHQLAKKATGVPGASIDRTTDGGWVMTLSLPREAKGESLEDIFRFDKEWRLVRWRSRFVDQDGEEVRDRKLSYEAPPAFVWGARNKYNQDLIRSESEVAMAH